MTTNRIYVQVKPGAESPIPERRTPRV